MGALVALPSAIWYSGAPFATAVVGIFVYRVLSLWIPMPFALASLRALRAMDLRPAQPGGNSPGAAIAGWPRRPLRVPSTAPTGRRRGSPACLSAQIAPSLIFVLADGIVADRIGPQAVTTADSIAATPLALGILWPVLLVCAAVFVPGFGLQIMMVQWTVALAKSIPPDKLARVSSYNLLGSVMAMPVGAILAGLIAAWAGVPATAYGAAALVLVATALALMLRDVRTVRADELGGSAGSAEVAAAPVAGAAAA